MVRRRADRPRSRQKHVREAITEDSGVVQEKDPALEVIVRAIQDVQVSHTNSHIVVEDWVIEEFHGPHTNESTCWCSPMAIYRDPVSSCQVFVHRTLEV